MATKAKLDAKWCKRNGFGKFFAMVTTSPVEMLLGGETPFLRKRDAVYCAVLCIRSSDKTLHSLVYDSFDSFELIISLTGNFCIQI